jgi:hypothetical protein
MASVSKTLLKTLPTDDEMVDILYALKSAPDHALAITTAAYLDHATELLIRNYLREDLTTEEHRRLFDGGQNGILATASAKIRIAYALRFFERPVYLDMLTVNDVRNVFAHSLHPVTFAHELVFRDCQKLSLLERRKDMYPDPTKFDAKEVYYNTVLDLFMGIQLNIRGIAKTI